MVAGLIAEVLFLLFFLCSSSLRKLTYIVWLRINTRERNKCHAPLISEFSIARNRLARTSAMLHLSGSVCHYRVLIIIHQSGGTYFNTQRGLVCYWAHVHISNLFCLEAMHTKFSLKQVSSGQVMFPAVLDKCFISVAVPQFLIKGWSEGCWGGLQNH